MMYADSKCTYSEENNPHRYIFKGKCFQCKKEVKVTILGSELYAYRKGEYIQNAMKSVSKEDREFLISGTCKECWDKMFKEPD